MLNQNKIYTVKSNATRDIRKAIERNECMPGEYEVRPTDGGFQVKKLNASTPARMLEPGATKITEIPDAQAALLTALFNARALTDKPIEERAGVWIPFASVHDSEKPHNLPKFSMSGVARGLARRGLIQTGRGDERIGKHVPVVQITGAGIAALS